MPLYQLLTDRTLAQASAITPTTLIHIVTTGDTSQNSAGSSYKAELGQLVGLFSGNTFTGNTFTGNTSATCINEFYVSDIYGCTGTTFHNQVCFETIPTGTTGYTLSVNENGCLLIATGTTSKDIIADNVVISDSFSGPRGNFSDYVRVSKIKSFSPLLINYGDEGDVYFGSTSGVTIDVLNSRIGIGTNIPSEKLDVSGKTKTINFQMTSGATNGYVLTSDASGNASWQASTGEFLPLSGGTVTGSTTFTNGLTATTISATTYQNLPDNVTGNYLPLSGGTVTGGTIFQSGLTANTIYISGSSIQSDTDTLTFNIQGTTIIDAGPGYGVNIQDSIGNTVFDSDTKRLISTTTANSVDWENRLLYKSDSTTISFDWENGILTGQTNIESSTISATTYQNLPISGTHNYLSKFSSGSTTLVDSQLRDDGSTVGLGLPPNTNGKFYVFTSTELYGLAGQNQNTNGIGVYGQALALGNTTGVLGLANGTSTSNIGVYGQANEATTNIGLKGYAFNGANNYSIQLQDGTEGIGKVLTSMTSDGKANWQTLPSSTFTGGTVTGSTTFTNGLSANTISATTIGNSGDCVDDLYVTNIHSCSPLNINPLNEGNVYFGSTSGVSIDLANTRIGIGTSTPQFPFQIVGANSTFYYDPTSVGGRFNVSGNTNIPRYDVSIGAYLTRPATGGSVGLRSWNDVSYPGYGKVGDMHIYAGNETYGLNIINGPGTNTEDYIRFYAGTDATSTSDIHIQGTGTTRGFVGLGIENPTAKLHVFGSTIVTGTLTATTVSATTSTITTSTSNNLIVSNPYVPTGSTDPTGVVGTISWSGNSIYLRNSTEWVRFTGETSW